MITRIETIGGRRTRVTIASTPGPPGTPLPRSGADFDSAEETGTPRSDDAPDEARAPAREQRKDAAPQRNTRIDRCG